MRRSLAQALAACVLAAVLPALHAQEAGAAVALGGTFHALTPSRILDTRSGSPLGPGTTLNVPIAGQGGVPPTSVSAVVLNVTVTNTTAPGFLTVFPAGLPIPVASNLNWVAGQTVAKLVTVGLGPAPRAHTTHAALPTSSSTWRATTPPRMFRQALLASSTPSCRPGCWTRRTGIGAPAAKLAAGQTLDLQVTGRGGVPSSGVGAVVLNVTATGPTTTGFLTVFPTGVTRPNASNLNFNAGETIPNRVMVGVGTGGKVSIFNPAGTTNVVADVNGWFTDSTAGGTGSWFTPVTPTRILDSRVGTGGISLPWGPNAGRVATVAGSGGVPAMTDTNRPTAVVANLTVTNTTTAGTLAAWPDTAAKPATSDVNWPQGGTVSNPTIVQVGPDRQRRHRKRQWLHRRDHGRGRLVHRSRGDDHSGCASGRQPVPRSAVAGALQLLAVHSRPAQGDGERGMEQRRLPAREVDGQEQPGRPRRDAGNSVLHRRRRPGR